LQLARYFNRGIKEDGISLDKTMEKHWSTNNLLSLSWKINFEKFRNNFLENPKDFLPIFFVLLNVRMSEPSGQNRQKNSLKE